MFPFFLKKTRVKAALFAGLISVLLTGLLLVSCDQPTGGVVNAQAPSITGQPTGGTWDVEEDDEFTLTVTASSPDGGKLSYQWYKNTSNTSTGGTTVGEDNKTLTLDSEDYEAGETCYFYVVVTNTNSAATGNKTATVTSSVATVTVTSVDPPAGLNGYFQTPLILSDYGWVDDGYSVDHATKKFYYYHDSTMESRWGGAIVHHTPADGDEPGILIVHVTEVKDSLWGPTQGKYYAAAYKDLETTTGSATVKFSNASWYDETTYEPAEGAKNEGCDTLAEAISEYTATSEYFGYFGTYTLHPATAEDLSDLQGDWHYTDSNEVYDQYIYILGTTLFHFMDDVDDGDSEGEYDPNDEYDVLGLVGDIVDCTDTTQTSGVLYIKVVKDAEAIYTTGKYTAVGWKIENDEYQFALGTEVAEALSAIKTTYGSSTSFTGGWYVFEKVED